MCRHSTPCCSQASQPILSNRKWVYVHTSESPLGRFISDSHVWANHTQQRFQVVDSTSLSPRGTFRVRMTNLDRDTTEKGMNGDRKRFIRLLRTARCDISIQRRSASCFQPDSLLSDSSMLPAHVLSILPSTHNRVSSAYSDTSRSFLPAPALRS